MITEYQIKALENKLATIKPDANGKYPPAYYALANKIKALKTDLVAQIKNKRWNDFLAQ